MKEKTIYRLPGLNSVSAAAADADVGQIPRIIGAVDYVCTDDNEVKRIGLGEATWG